MKLFGVEVLGWGVIFRSAQKFFREKAVYLSQVSHEENIMLKRFATAALLGSLLAAAPQAVASAPKKAAAKKQSDIQVVKVVFIGNKHVPSEELSANLVNKEVGFINKVAGKGNYHPEQLKMDALRVRDVLYQHGYLDARVSGPKVKIVDGKATLTYTIREGLPYKTASVRIRHPRTIDTRDLQAKLKLHSGQTFNVELLRQDIRSIAKYLGDRGYPFARVEPRFQKHKNRTMSVVYTVQTGTKATIGNIIIHGNKKTKDQTIRNYLSLAPGDRYNLDDIIKAQDELNRSGFFETVTIRPVAKRKGVVDLIVDVKEDKTGQIMGALGYDSLEGLFVEGSFSEKNLFGTGISAGISGSYSKLKKNGTLSFDDPHVGGTDFGLYGGVFKTDTQDDSEHTYGYDKTELGGYLGVRRRITRELSGSIDYNYVRVKYSDVNTSIATNGNLDNYIKSSIGLSLTYNNTDSFYTPRRGIYAKAHVEYAGLGSASGSYKLAKYLKSSLKFAAYYGLEDTIGYDLILRYKMQAGYIHDMGYVPEAERLHLGGYYQGVRGYRSGTIHPAGGGGLKSIVNSIEASVPISKRNKIRLTGFIDYGMVGNYSVTEVKKKSVGAQIEWRSPLGDVNFVFARAIGKAPGDRTNTFEFTIGKEF
jgi:outer membrane protein insertion porin family